MEIIRLQTINNRSHFAHAAILEFQNRDAGGRVFILGKLAVDRVRGIGADDFHILPHAQEQRVQRVATGRQETASAGRAKRVPTKLSVPRPDSVIIIDFTVMDASEQSSVEHGFDGQELAGEAALEADASLDSGLPDA